MTVTKVPILLPSSTVQSEVQTGQQRKSSQRQLLKTINFVSSCGSEGVSLAMAAESPADDIDRFGSFDGEYNEVSAGDSAEEELSLTGVDDLSSCRNMLLAGPHLTSAVDGHAWIFRLRLGFATVKFA